MNKHFRRLMAVCLMLAILLTALPLSTHADDVDDADEPTDSLSYENDDGDGNDDDDDSPSSDTGDDGDDDSYSSGTGDDGDDDSYSSGTGDDGDDDDSSSSSDTSDDGDDGDDDDDNPSSGTDDDGDDDDSSSSSDTSDTSDDRDDGDDNDHVPWIERITVPAYARELYDTLETGSSGDDDDSGFFLQDANFRVDGSTPESPNRAGIHADRAEVITFSLQDPYAGGDPNGLHSMAFGNEAFYSVNVSAGDQAINYHELKQGDVVKTSSFNGVFVTKLPVGANFEQEKKDAVTHTATVFQAFDRDHPEVFWLSGKCRIRMISTTAPGGEKTAYLFLVLADKEGFCMRSDAWKADGALADGIRRRDDAVNRILASVTANTPQEQVRQLNRWLTENNQYNTTPDLTTIGNEPHECLSALEGRAGTDGPVCDGYARAFKVLCDQLGIGCVLENGYAKTSPQSEGGFHMWNAAQIGTSWYGMDVTWNDPTVTGSTGAKSGKENENYLLVGADSQVRGMLFRDSHPATNQAIEAGVAFTNRPALSAEAYSGPGAPA